MNAKQYLQQAYRLNEFIESDKRELKQLESLLTSISPVDISQERVQGGNIAHDKIGDTIVKIDALKEHINNEINHFVDLKAEIREKIMKIKDKNCKLLLKYRYIEFMKWEQIAEKMDYDVRHIYTLHNKALKIFDKTNPSIL